MKLCSERRKEKAVQTNVPWEYRSDEAKPGTIIEGNSRLDRRPQI